MLYKNTDLEKLLLKTNIETYFRLMAGMLIRKINRTTVRWDWRTVCEKHT